jgi:hypothetical protein
MSLRATLRQATVTAILTSESGPEVSVIDEYGGVWSFPVPCTGGSYSPPAVGSQVFLAFKPGGPDPVVVGSLFDRWGRVESGAEAGVEYPMNNTKWGDIRDTAMFSGPSAFVASAKNGLSLDARRTASPTRIQLSEEGVLRISKAGDASEGVLLADVTLQWLQALVSNYNALVTRYNALEAWAVGLGFPAQPPITPTDAPTESLVSSTVEIASSAKE